jgi:hypothetical protein
MAADGDPDPISAGTAGEAALWGGSIAVVGMAANPFGAHQADPYVSCAPGCHRNRARFGVRGQGSGVRGRVRIRSDVFQNSKARRCAVRDATWAATTHRHPFSQPEFGHDWKLKQSQLRAMRCPASVVARSCGAQPPFKMKSLITRSTMSGTSEKSLMEKSGRALPESAPI